jgi:glycosyltransferase involved in cell wall biosynthesis
MRIAWFSPGSGESGIVEYSRRVLGAMRTRATPVLFCAGAAERFPEGVETIDFTAEPDALAELGAYDAVFYNLGNNLKFHGQIWEAARTHPGILVLHDRVLHHFFVEYFQHRMRSPERYLQRMLELYGPASADVAAHMLDPRRWSNVTSEEFLRYSFIEEAVSVARGVVVHSHWHAEAVRRAWSGPLCELWLPSNSVSRPPTRPGRGGDRVTLLTLGHVEFNKHADKVVRAFARDPELAAHARYLIAGAYHPDSPYVRQLGEEITARSLAGTVSLLGYLSPTELDEHAAAADVFVNLRRPNLEGSSASLMYELAFGKPVIVYRSGSFAELPDDAVVKVTPEADGELHHRLRELVFDERRRERIGAAARRFAESRSLPSYARELVAFAADVGAWAPRLEVADRVGRELAALGVDPRLEGIEAITREAVTLFGMPRR